ncbi:MAG: thiamine phosphate synthase [Prosthecochloris sp.]|uniref:Thiamine-phosphate synthase n=1 Tax=Prosthecochloris aestuarii (strain DSM 271 / SK 413) TaxID=290512 RepID=B4S7K7_PROA2|nr:MULTISPECIES: thiamine phosphate synthase [Prosthecochloris]ACF46044.1 thiamine-phosphate pyrophosphorylase [Prosthecochloris aestuarii DSM 271]MCW8799091.1 thiamine phosphate synthase [Prosthecochloris sp.]RDD30442.1 thiamine phosphate synthase [Prosthecochloris sp. ZM]
MNKLLCFITTQQDNPEIVAEEALKGGTGMIQLRHKNASGHDLFTWALSIGKMCRRYGALFIVNDRLDIALAAGADGVHLGQNDLPIDVARKLLPSPAIIGCSVSSVHEALDAQQKGADYIGLGHIFPTGSKQKENAPLGPEYIRTVKQSVDIPLIAIGGIGLDNAREVMSNGADGLAVISAISSAVNPAEAARELAIIIEQT